MKVYTVTDYERCKVLGVFATKEEAEAVKFEQKIPIHCHIEEVDFKKECRCKSELVLSTSQQELMKRVVGSFNIE